MMKVKCPKCGAWCESSGKMLDRAVLSAVKGDGKYLGNITEKSNVGFLKKLGEQTDELIGGLMLTPKGIIGAFLAKKYQFLCKCGYEFEMDDTDEALNKAYVEMTRNEAKEVDVSDTQSVSKFISSIQTAIDNEGSDKLKSIQYSTLGYIQSRIGKRQDMEKSLNRAMALDPNNVESETVKAMNCEDGNPLCSLKSLQHLLEQDILGKDSSFYSVIEIREEENRLLNHYHTSFLSIPRNKRKFIIVADKVELLQDSFIVLEEDLLPPELHFDGELYEKGQLYVIHPYKDNVYLKVSSYELSLFEEEMSELGLFLQAMGAKSISVKDRREKTITEVSKGKFFGKLKGGYKLTSGEAEIKGSQSQDEFEHVLSDYLLEQEFNPLEREPVLPEGLIWFYHRESWQKIKKQVDIGNFKRHRIAVNTARIKQISQSEELSLKADFDTLVANGALDANIEIDKMFKQSTEHSWILDVEFYPPYKQKTNI